MGEPNYSYSLKPQKKEGKVWERHYYLYLNKTHNGQLSSAYISQVDASDPRARLILLKRDTDTELRKYAEQDAIVYAVKFLPNPAQ